MAWPRVEGRRLGLTILSLCHQLAFPAHDPTLSVLDDISVRRSPKHLLARWLPTAGFGHGAGANSRNQTCWRETIDAVRRDAEMASGIVFGGNDEVHAMFRTAM